MPNYLEVECFNRCCWQDSSVPRCQMQCISFYFVLVKIFLNLKFKPYNYGTLLCTKEMNQSLMQLCLENT